MKRYTLLLSFFVFCMQAVYGIDYTCAKPKPYTLAYSNNVRGDIKIIGNMSLCADQDKDGSCDDPGFVRNNSIYMIDIAPTDGNSSIFNISKAKLDLPPGSEILWAKVYWQGMLYKGVLFEKNKTAKIEFKAPGSSSFATIDPTSPSYERNWVYYSKDRFYYQASADVTDIVKKAGEGWYTVANVYTRTGPHSKEGIDLPPGHPIVVIDLKEGIPPGGSYGGWALVVAYKNSSLPLNNLSIFDGYMGIVGIYDVGAANDYKNDNNCTQAGVAQSIDIPLSGFITPKTGKVNSKFMIFAGEGDVGVGCTWARGDMLKLSEKDGTKHLLSNPRNPSDDPLNSSISYFGADIDSSKLDPYYSPNKNGIDIDVYDTSSIIQNNQTSTTITIATNGDGYQPSVFALSTQIYESQLCYVEDFYLNGFKYDGKPLSAGTVLDVKTTIKNDGIDRAEKISILIPSSNTLQYSPGSIKIDGIAKTDISGDDEAEAVDKNITARIGTTASGMSGGYLDSKASSDVEYKATLFYDKNASATLERVYRVNYTDDTLGIDFKNLELKRCSGSLVIIPTVYKPAATRFNVLDKGKPITDANISTKIVNKDINLSLVSLDENLSALKDLNATVGVMLIDTASGNVIKNLGDINLAGSNGRVEIPPFKYDKANKQVNARVYYCENSFGNIALDWKSCYPAADDVCNPLAGYSCKTSDSLDDFAIRPDSFVVQVTPIAPDTALRAGKDFNLSVKALDADGNIVANFMQDATGYDIDINETKPITSSCERNISVSYVKSPFVNGIASMSANYPDVGILSYKAKELIGGEYAKVDEDDTPDNLRLITPKQTISGEIKAAKMAVGWNFANGDTINGYTYYNDYNSSDPDANLMAASFDLNVSVLNSKNQKLKNFTNGCYAKDVNISFTADLWSDTNNTYEIVAEYSDINDVKIPESLLKSKLPHTIQTGISSYNYKVEDILFSKGTGAKKAKFNLKRDANKALNPLKFTILDINASVDTITDTDMSAKTLKFLYARAHIPDQEAVGKNLKAKVFYEIYCKECTKDKFGISSLHESVDSVNWYILENINENLCSYTTDAYNPYPGEPNENITAKYGAVRVDEVDSKFMKITSHKTPTVVNLDYKPKKYLIYDPYNKNAQTQSFTATFSQRPADWAGKGDVGLSVDLNVSQRHGVDKIEW